MSIKSLVKEYALNLFSNGRYKKYLYVFAPYGRGLLMEAEDIINLKSFPTVAGCTVNTWNKFQLIEPSEYRKAMKGLAPLVKVNEFDLPDGGLAGDIKYATSKHSSMYLAQQSDDKMSGGMYVWEVIITALSKEKLDRQVEVILNRWGGVDNFISKKYNPIQYFELVDTVGTHKFKRGALFDYVLLSDKVNTTTIENYARLCFFQRTTLQDELGEEFGFDFLAPSQIGDDGNPKYPKVLIDAKGYLNSLAIVAHPRDFSRYDYVFEDIYKDEANTIKKPQSQASVISQQIANRFLLEGKKTIHLVLNDFDYFKLQTPYNRDSKQLQAVIREETQIIDGSKISVNPLQPFAKNMTDEKEEEQPAYRRSKKKFNSIIQALVYYQGEDTGIADKVFDSLMKLAELWNEDNDVMVKRRNYLGLPAMKYPAFDRVITQFTTMERLFRQDNKIKEAEETARIQRRLESFLTDNRGLIGKTTTLELDKSKVNYYINLNNLDRLQKNIQVMNLFDYVTEFLDAGDLIVLHGADQLDIRTSDYLKEQFERTFEKQVRIVLSYDVTDTLEAPEKNTLGTSNVFVMNGKLYNFNLGVDFSFIGRMDDSRNYEQMVRAELSERTKVDIGFEGAVGRSIFYRPATKTLHLVGVKPVC
jgi:hypothetical protein